MKTAASWLRGGIVGLVLVAPATGRPAERATLETASATLDLSDLSEPPGLPDVPYAPYRAFTPVAVDQALLAPLAEATDRIDPFPGHTYGDLEDVACLVALEERGVPYERYERRARGVETPVRLMGALHGVRFQHADTPDWLASARREILDCRLVLALDDLAALVHPHGVVTVLHYGVYRGDLPLPRHGRPLHHVAALAIDVAAFVKSDGTRLDVRRDWAGRVGDRTCDDASQQRTESAESTVPSGELHGILCDVAREKLFHQALTPNHDARHKDHFHLEVMRGTEWTLVE